MTRKSIATNMAVVSCDVCGRTLLRGEHADVFLHNGSRRTVCELCTARARNEGWIREGLDGVMSGRANERGGAARSLLDRLRHRRETRQDEPVALDAALGRRPEPPGTGYHEEPAEAAVLEARPAPVVAPAERSAAAAPPEPPPELRSVHAIPTNAELKIARALEVFNLGPHPRTVAGIARSLGAPIVTAAPSATEGSIVTIVVAWELSWYRYEVNLADEASGVRVTAQGTELAELEPSERMANAGADDRGGLHPAATVS